MKIKSYFLFFYFNVANELKGKKTKNFVNTVLFWRLFDLDARFGKRDFQIRLHLKSRTLDFSLYTIYNHVYNCFLDQDL